MIIKKDLLTVLGCSSSLALTLLTTHPIQANALTVSGKEYVFTAPTETANEALLGENLAITSENAENCGCNADNPLELDLTDEEGDRAIARFGCDCAGCRYLLRQPTE